MDLEQWAVQQAQLGHYPVIEYDDVISITLCKSMTYWDLATQQEERISYVTNAIIF